ncbi:MAG: hypothetical protein M3Y09_10520 [Actinomycetota bacterium]|nr:hypothetical protein [Actinomycetota bacterium]
MSVADHPNPGYFQITNNLEVTMLLTIAVLLLVLAVLGGLLVHPLIFLLALVAVVVLVGNRRGLGTGSRHGAIR